MTMKRKLPLIALAVLFAALCAVLTSCSFIFGNKEDSDKVTPTIAAIEATKAKDGFETSREYLFNQNCNGSMAVDGGESYYIIVRYNNPSKFNVTKLKINGQTITEKDFDKTKSTKEATYIKYTVDDAAATERLNYTVESAFYTDGTSSPRMRWSSNVADADKTITVSVKPMFTLTLDYQNADKRVAAMGDSTKNTVETKTGVYYNTQLNYSGVVTADFNGDSDYTMPVKPGGWIFVGWYTQPGGKGELVTADDTYFFWANITLYAHYERMFELEVVELETPIIYSYTQNGRNNDKSFTSGVVVKNKDFKNNEYTHYPVLTIPDTVTIENITVTEKENNAGLPSYIASVSATEYPVVKIGNEAFAAFSTLKTVTIGKFIEEIGYRAFGNCKKLSVFNFSQEAVLKYIGDYAFESTEALGISPAFTLPDTIEYLGNFAFRYSGWTNVRNKESTASGGESVLRVRANWKFIGYKCFFGTGFAEVVFDPGCHFEGQIDTETGGEIESSKGYTTIRKEENLIGASLFACCKRLNNVQLLVDPGEANGLNIIPDACFDLFSWTDSSVKIEHVTFSEGLTYIGERAFFYQENIRELKFPKSLQEIDVEAFYNARSVESIDFNGVESQLTTLHSSCFGNLVKIDSVEITSEVFSKYGSGVFRGCDRMKCVIFSNIKSIPTGYKSSDPESKKEVVVGHVQSDFLYATGEAGETGEVSGDVKMTYSSPLRVFCPSAKIRVSDGGEEKEMTMVDAFKEELKRGKEVRGGGVSSGTSAFSSSVFVHPKELIKDYEYVDPTDASKKIKVTVAIQELYIVADKKMTTAKKGYSLVYWSERSKNIVLPTSNDLGIGQPVIEVAMYAIPSSVETLYVPSSYTRFEHDAFNACTRLNEITFENPDTLEYIGNYAFFGTALSSFTAGEGLKAIGDYAFRNCKLLKWVDLKQSPITNLYKGGTKKLDLAKYDYEVEDNDKDWNNYLGYGAFQGCTALQWVYLPDDIQRLCTATFDGCKALRTLIIPSKNVSTETDTKSDECFYQYNTPNTVFDSRTVHLLDIYVPNEGNLLERHKKIWDRNYNYIDKAPSHP